MSPDLRIRPYRTADRDEVLLLAPRLAIGVAPWRDPASVRTAVADWVSEDLDRAEQSMPAVPGVPERPPWIVLVAEVDGEVGAFCCAEQRLHWSGDPQAYIGELVVADDLEGRGIGRALVAEVRAWARDHRLRHIVLETGAANKGALAFYEQLGFEPEDLRLRAPS